MAGVADDLYLGDEVCHHSDCTCNEPNRLVVRKLRSTDWREAYCTDHDPLQDTEISDRWEPV